MNNIIDEKKYVVLDVETNGLSARNCDLLSISIYKPDDKKEYDRFLPLEVTKYISRDITKINGITKETLIGAKPLSQADVNYLMTEFELDKRTILTYGNIDEKFIKYYFKRKKLIGFEKMKFYNFKRDIISSCFSEGKITKDNLCKIYGIENVKNVHRGINDCILEWKLYKKMNSNKLFAYLKKFDGNYIYEYNDSYIIPAAYLSNYTNFKYQLDYMPTLKCDYNKIKEYKIPYNEIQKIFIKNQKNYEFYSIFFAIRKILCDMISEKKEDCVDFLEKNKSKLKLLGIIPIFGDEIIRNDKADIEDGMIDYSGNLNDSDELFIKEAECILNNGSEYTQIMTKILPLAIYIVNNIFKESVVFSEELVISEDNKIFSLCDLSDEKSVLKITKGFIKSKKLLYQLYYQSKGRSCYVLDIGRGLLFDDYPFEHAFVFTIYEVNIIEK